MNTLKQIVEQLNRSFLPKRYVPKEYSVLINPTDIPKEYAEVFVSDEAEKNRWIMCAFWGKQAKPNTYYYYHTKEKRDAAVQTFYDRVRNAVKRKKEDLAKRKEYKHSYKVGDILVASWGYDQTNTDYYQVVDVKGKFLYLREIGAKQTDGEHTSGAKNSFKNDKVLKRLAGINGVNIDSVIHASLWDGRPMYETPWGMGH